MQHREPAAGGRPSSQTAVFVVGGGPAGLAAAIAARQHGLDVTVADGAKPPQVRRWAAHPRSRRNPALIARLLLAMDRSPWLQRRAMRALAAEPTLFSRLLALHVGAPVPPPQAVRSLCTLSWRLLMA